MIVHHMILNTTQLQEITENRYRITVTIADDKISYFHNISSLTKIGTLGQRLLVTHTMTHIEMLINTSHFTF